MKALAWCYYALVALGSFVLFWIPLGWHGGIPHVPPLGLTLALVLCLARAWTPTATVPSIKLLALRPAVDTWRAPIERLLGWLIGQPEDGPSGRFAYGPSWTGAYNPTGSTWLAFCWQCRNWFAGFGYRTWIFGGVPPILKRPYTVLGRERLLQLGWTALPAADGWSGTFRYRMVCSA